MIFRGSYMVEQLRSVHVLYSYVSVIVMLCAFVPNCFLVENWMALRCGFLIIFVLFTPNRGFICWKKYKRIQYREVTTIMLTID